MSGEGTTALRALPVVRSPASPILNYNIGIFIEPNFQWTETGRGDTWRFARCGEEGRSPEVREKRRVSDHATVGLYAFGSAEPFRSAHNRTYAETGDAEVSERHIAPMYNDLVGRGLDVFVEKIPFEVVHPLCAVDNVDRVIHR